MNLCSPAENRAECAICGRAEELIFCFHSSVGSQYYFCSNCQHIPQIHLWQEKGNVLEWVEPEQFQKRLV